MNAMDRLVNCWDSVIVTPCWKRRRGDSRRWRMIGSFRPLLGILRGTTLIGVILIIDAK